MDTTIIAAALAGTSVVVTSLFFCVEIAWHQVIACVQFGLMVVLTAIAIFVTPLAYSQPYLICALLVWYFVLYFIIERILVKRRHLGTM